MAQKEVWELEMRDKFSRNMDKAGKGLDGLRGKFSNISSGLGGIAKVIGGVFVADKIIDFTKGIANLGIEMEQTQAKFTTFLGSQEKANDLIADLQAFGAVTPFQDADLLKNTELLLAFGTSMEDIMPTMAMLGDVSGGNAEKLQSLSLAYSQIQSQGRLMGQDLMQLINAGFNPLKVMSEQTGKSMGELKDAMSKGAISAEDVKNAFIVATSEGGQFAGMMEKMSETTGGKISTLISQIQQLGIKMGKAIMPAVDSFVSMGMVLIDNIDTIAAVAKNVSFVVGPVLAVVGAMKLWTGVQWLLNVAMTANPIGLIVAGIAALVAGITIAWKESETFRGALYGIWEAMKAVGDVIMQFVAPLLENLKMLWDGIINLDFSKIWEGLKGVWKALTGFLLEPLRTILFTIDKIAGTNLSDSLNKMLGNKGIAQGIAENVPGAVKKGFEDGVADFRADQKSGTGEATEKANRFGLSENAFSNLGGGGTGGKGSSSLSGGVSTVRAAAPKTFNVNIQSLIEQVKFDRVDNQTDAQNIKELITRYMLEAINDTQIAAQ